MKTKCLVHLLVFISIWIAQTESEDTNIVVNNETNDINKQETSSSIVISNDQPAQVTTADGVKTLDGQSVNVVNGKIQGNITSDVPAAPEGRTDTNGTEIPDDKPVRLIDPGLDARHEIANYNKFMDEIYRRMNAAMKSKNLDPMDLRLQPNTAAAAAAAAASATTPAQTDPTNKTRDSLDAESKYSTTAKPTKSTTQSILILSTPAPNSEAVVAGEDDVVPPPPPPSEKTDLNDTAISDIDKVRGWLYGMSTLNRTADVSIFIQENFKTVQCPFSLGPLELRVSKSAGEGKDKKTKTAKATTDLMLGFMDMRIELLTGKAEITRVVFDEPGGVDIKGSLKRRADTKNKDKERPYRLVLASQAALSLKKVARLVVAQPIQTK